MLGKSVRLPLWLVLAIPMSSLLIGAAFSAANGADPDRTPAFKVAVASPEAGIFVRDSTPGTGGVLVTEVTCGPLRQGDVLVEIDQSPLSGRSDLEAKLSTMAPGTIFETRILRDGKVQTAFLERGSQPLTAQPSADEDTAAVFYGLHVAKLNEAEGLLITDVDLGSRASMVGLRPGNVILELNGRPLDSPAQLAQYLRELHNEPAIFKVIDRGHINYVIISPG